MSEQTTKTRLEILITAAHGAATGAARRAGAPRARTGALGERQLRALVHTTRGFGAGQIVAVGSTYGETQPDAAEEDRPLILIGSEDGWQRVDTGGVVAGSLMGLSADPSGRIWAFGASASSPLLLSSHDGTSWTDTSAPLARVAPDQVPVAIAFQTDLVGWIATRGLLAGGGPQLFRTEDAGRTWVLVEHTGSKHVFGTYALRIPQGDRDVVELVVSNPDSVSVRTVSKDGVRVETIASAHEMRAWAFVSVADTWWMFGRKDGCAARNESCVEEVGGAVQVDFPAIRRVDAKRAALDRLIDAPTWTDIRAGHFFDTQIGIAGGVISHEHDPPSGWFSHEHDPGGLRVFSRA